MGFKYRAFPNGLSLEEGVQRAGDWWDKTGREVIPRMLDEEPQDAAQAGFGIMSGVEFNKLTTAEQHRVLIAWYTTQGKEL